MKEENVVFVIGAGASKEFNLPLGVELLDEIEKVTKCNNRMPTMQDHLVYYAACGMRTTDPNLYDIQNLVSAAEKINKAIPLVNSIDNYIDNHRGDKCIEVMGKFAIARCILKAEKESNLFFNTKSLQRIVFSKCIDNWLNKLFKILTQNCTYEELKARFSKVSFIIFNYDRCIEFYFFHALQAAYHISKEQAYEVISHLNIYHAYGQVGELPYINNNAQSVDYGKEVEPEKLRELALKLKTFTEGVDTNDGQIQDIRLKYANADKVFFLGFGFHKLNLDLLKPTGSNQKMIKAKYFGTAYKISRPNIEAIKSELNKTFGVNNENVYLRGDLMCSQFIDEYSRYF